MHSFLHIKMEHIVSGFVYIKRNTKCIVFININVTQSALFFACKNASPPPSIQKFIENYVMQSVQIFEHKNITEVVFLFAECLDFCRKKSSVTQSVLLFEYKCQPQTFHEKSLNINVWIFYIKHNGKCIAFCKVSPFLYIKRLAILFASCIYARFLSLMAVIVIFFSYKNIFICETFLCTQKTKQLNPVYVCTFFKAQILRALLSNKRLLLYFCQKSTIQ